MNQREKILRTMFMGLSKDRLADIAVQLMLAGLPPVDNDPPEVEYPNNGKRISQGDIDAVLRVAGPLGRLHQHELELLALELGRKPDSIAAILRSNFEAPVTTEREPDEAIDGPS